MKTSKNLLLAFAAALGLAQMADSQTVLSTVTLGAAITTTNQTYITLSSTSGMTASGPANQINTVLYVDREFMRVLTVPDSTHVTVQRSQGIGASARPATHLNGATVYYANTTTYQPSQYTINAAEYFTNGSVALESEVSGSCTATSELALPKIYLFDGNVYGCRGGSSGGQWFLEGNGSQGAPYGHTINAFCTGTVGSGETEYLVGAACSGQTTSTTRYVIPAAGTLANLYVTSSAAVTGGTGKDVLTVLLNGSASALTCTIAASGTSCNDATEGSGHSVQVTAGQVLTFKYVTATSDTAANIAVSVTVY